MSCALVSNLWLAFTSAMNSLQASSMKVLTVSISPMVSPWWMNFENSYFHALG